MRKPVAPANSSPGVTNPVDEGHVEAIDREANAATRYVSHLAESGMPPGMLKIAAMSPVSGGASIDVSVFPDTRFTGGSPTLVSDADVHTTDDAITVVISIAVSVITGNPNWATDAERMSVARMSAPSRRWERTASTSPADEKNFCWRTSVAVMIAAATPAIAAATTSSTSVNARRFSRMGWWRENDPSQSGRSRVARASGRASQLYFPRSSTPI